jgi:hypothetical protein
MEMRRVIPEEFWWDFDEIVRLLREAMQARIDRVGEVAAELAGLSDREVGLRRTRCRRKFPGICSPIAATPT